MPTAVIALLCSVPLVLVLLDAIRERNAQDDES
jgi:hypothetical protein